MFYFVVKFNSFNITLISEVKMNRKKTIKLGGMYFTVGVDKVFPALFFMSTCQYLLFCTLGWTEDKVVKFCRVSDI